MGDAATTIPAPFAPFEPRWDRPQLNERELLDSSAFEWWYFDLASEDGTSLVVIFSRRNPVLCSGGASIYIEYQSMGATFRRVRNYPASHFSTLDEANGLQVRVDRHTVRMVRSGEQFVYTLDVDLPEFGLQLEMHPLHRGFLPTADGTYFRAIGDPARRTCVSFSAPLMRATGSIRYNGTANPVSGRGYHDHPWGTAQLFNTHRCWNWGRMVDATSGAMFAKVTPRPTFEGALCFMYSAPLGVFEPTVTSDLTVAESDWRRDSLFGIRYPHQLAVTSGGEQSTLSCEGSLLDTPIYDRARVTWTAGSAAPGTGWVEYYDVPDWMQGLVFFFARIGAFFWRPFPWFGR